MNDLSTTAFTPAKNINTNSPDALMNRMTAYIQSGANTITKSIDNYLVTKDRQKLVQNKTLDTFHKNMLLDKQITDKINTTKLLNNTYNTLNQLSEKASNTDDPKEALTLKQQIQNTIQQAIKTAQEYGLNDLSTKILSQGEKYIKQYTEDINDKVSTNLVQKYYQEAKQDPTINGDNVDKFYRLEKYMYSKANDIKDPKLKLAYLQKINQMLNTDKPNRDDIIIHESKLRAFLKNQSNTDIPTLDTISNNNKNINNNNNNYVQIPKDRSKSAKYLISSLGIKDIDYSNESDLKEIIEGRYKTTLSLIKHNKDKLKNSNIFMDPTNGNIYDFNNWSIDKDNPNTKKLLDLANRLGITNKIKPEENKWAIENMGTIVKALKKELVKQGYIQGGSKAKLNNYKVVGVGEYRNYLYMKRKGLFDDN